MPILVIAQNIEEEAIADTTQIFVKNSDNFVRDATSLPATQYLRGNVKMYQDSIYMFCDSAILINNSLNAINNVVILHSDTIKVFADSLFYEGDGKVADLYDNVVLENGEQKLFTNRLNYQLNEKIATYTDTALLVNERARVSSIKGVYKVNEKMVKFEQEVVIIDSVFTMHTDSLLYNTELDVATFIAPTKIFREDQTIECGGGFYKLNQDYAEFEKDPIVRDSSSTAKADKIIYDGKNSLTKLIGHAEYISDNELATGDAIFFNEATDEIIIEGNGYYKDQDQEVIGDRIVYNRDTKDIEVEGKATVNKGSTQIAAWNLDYDSKTKLGFASGDVVWVDTIEKYQLKAESITYNDSTEYVKAMFSEGTRPLLRKLIDQDTMYISADTLEFFKVVEKTDTIKGSVNDTINAFEAKKSVKILMNSISAKCDFLKYSDKDSIFVLEDKPFMWNDTTQFSADTIFMYLENKTLSKLRLENKGKMISELDGDYYNQIVGKRFIAYFDSSEIKSMDVSGNSRALYYMQDDSSAYIGQNLTECSYMTFYFEEDDLSEIKFYEEPSSTMLPIQKVGKGDLYLDGFNWKIEWKPKSIADLLKVDKQVVIPNLEAVKVDEVDLINETELKGKIPKEKAEIKDKKKLISPKLKKGN
jgi:lipopolysaccharide export system protein LptA